MIKMNPDDGFCVYTWSGSVELQGEDLHDMEVDAWVEYETDGNAWRLISYKSKRRVTNKLYLKDGKTPFREHLIEDITDDVTEKAIEDIFDQYIVQEGL